MAQPRPVPAQPNQSEIKAKVLKVEQSPIFADRWHVEIEVMESRPLVGPNFARVGERVSGFTFAPSAPTEAGDVVSANAEFIGDERGGQFQLSAIKHDQPMTD